MLRKKLALIGTENVHFEPKRQEAQVFKRQNVCCKSIKIGQRVKKKMHRRLMNIYIGLLSTVNPVQDVFVKYMMWYIKPEETE